ncbi:MAG TPA: hypothetical protein VMG12_08995, partial [Polyangiaceae bacterium]|nr:hypothetical protein [Polyangiaceae bacterium]
MLSIAAVDPMMFWRNPSSGESSTLGSTRTGTRFLRDRLILICKVFAFIDLSYGALFALALKLDSHASYLS